MMSDVRLGILVGKCAGFTKPCTFCGAYFKSLVIWLYCFRFVKNFDKNERNNCLFNKPKANRLSAFKL